MSTLSLSSIESDEEANLIFHSPDLSLEFGRANVLSTKKIKKALSNLSPLKKRQTLKLSQKTIMSEQEAAGLVGVNKEMDNLGAVGGTTGEIELDDSILEVHPNLGDPSSTKASAMTSSKSDLTDINLFFTYMSENVVIHSKSKQGEFIPISPPKATKAKKSTLGKDWVHFLTILDQEFAKISEQKEGPPSSFYVKEEFDEILEKRVLFLAYLNEGVITKYFNEEEQAQLSGEQEKDSIPRFEDISTVSLNDYEIHLCAIFNDFQRAVLYGSTNFNNAEKMLKHRHTPGNIAQAARILSRIMDDCISLMYQDLPPVSHKTAAELPVKALPMFALPKLMINKFSDFIYIYYAKGFRKGPLH